MKTEKLSLKGIKNVLSRAELKNIMAGSGGGSGGGGGTDCGIHCAPNCNTSVYIYCYGSNGAYLGMVVGNTCNKSGQQQQCIMGGYTATTTTQSDCIVGCV